jgi:hypothetical protein
MWVSHKLNDFMQIEKMFFVYYRFNEHYNTFEINAPNLQFKFLYPKMNYNGIAQIELLCSLLNYKGYICILQ